MKKEVWCSVVIYCGFYLRLFGGFSFGCFLIYVLKCFSFCVRRAKEFKVFKCLVNILVQFVVEKCVIQRISVEADLRLAV